jgi:hypothetical protein
MAQRETDTDGDPNLWIAKANQPLLHAQPLGLPWPESPVVHDQHDCGHSRID